MRSSVYTPCSMLLLAVTACQAAEVAGAPLAAQQTQYEFRVGETAQMALAPESLAFMLIAKSLSVSIARGGSGGLVVGRNHAHTQVLLAASSRTVPGEYQATISATSAAGVERVTTLDIVAKPRQTVPSGYARPPVVLLNGWETGFTGECTVSSSSSDVFGNLAQYLVSDGVPIVYFFDNCVEDPNDIIEGIGNALGTYLNTITYSNGDQVPLIDLVGFSMGGLIARSYLAGLQSDGTATPPNPALVRDLVLIASPNFGSFVAENYYLDLEAGTQSAELVPGSSFLWNLATWNQRGDDLQGVNVLGIIGNAGEYLPSLESATELNNASDGIVTETSASATFGLPPSPPTVIVPYCQIDPADWTNITFGSFLCDAPGIANVTSDTQETGEIVRSFLAGTGAWTSVGKYPANDPYLSVDGGIFFGLEDQTGTYATDVTAVTWGSIELTPGEDTDVIYYTDFVSGASPFEAISTSLGTVKCGGDFEEPAGYYSAARCKINTAIYDVEPRLCGPGWTVASGANITLTGMDFANQCTSCQVTVTPASTGVSTALSVSSWTNSSITAALPSSISGLVTIQVTAVPGTDAITAMVAAPGTIASVVNAGSFQPGLASASWMTLCGAGFTSSTEIWGTFTNGLLPTALGGVSVTIDNIPAYVEYVSPSQINILAPDDATYGTVAVQVTSAGQTSNTVYAQKQEFAPSFFTFDGGKYVAAEHANYGYVGKSGIISGVTTTPAQIGETILLYGTGFGPTNPTVPTANLVTKDEPLANTATVTIGGKSAAVQFAGITASGLYQLNVTIPSGLSSGDQAIFAQVGGFQTQLGVYVTVQ